MAHSQLLRASDEIYLALIQMIYSIPLLFERTMSKLLITFQIVLLIGEIIF